MLDHKPQTRSEWRRSSIRLINIIGMTAFCQSLGRTHEWVQNRLKVDDVELDRVDYAKALLKCVKCNSDQTLAEIAAELGHTEEWVRSEIRTIEPRYGA